MSFQRKITLRTIYKIAFLEAMALSLVIPSVTSSGELPGVLACNSPSSIIQCGISSCIIPAGGTSCPLTTVRFSPSFSSIPTVDATINSTSIADETVASQFVFLNQGPTSWTLPTTGGFQGCSCAFELLNTVNPPTDTSHRLVAETIGFTNTYREVVNVQTAGPPGEKLNFQWSLNLINWNNLTEVAIDSVGLIKTGPPDVIVPSGMVTTVTFFRVIGYSGDGFTPVVLGNVYLELYGVIGGSASISIFSVSKTSVLFGVKTTTASTSAKTINFVWKAVLK